VKTFFLASLAVLLILAAPAANSARYKVFDPPGSTSTIVTGINTAGAVSGWSFQGGMPNIAFIRQPDGKILSFQVRGAGQMFSTFAEAINTDGAVAGYYYDRHGVQNGFIRAADGTITEIHGPIRDLQCIAINDHGDVVGNYWTGQHTAGFIRTADGTITIIDPPGASYTYPKSVNNDLLVAGQFAIGSGTSHGFLLGPDGHFTDITPPDLASKFHGALFPSAINGPGAIVGQYEAQNNAPGYLRSPGGSVTLFGPRNALAVNPSAINDDGLIAGYFARSDHILHGFVRAVDGSIKTFDPPGSIETAVSGINLSGIVAGWFDDGSMSHGYLRTP
jgi:hypothetical protein